MENIYLAAYAAFLANAQRSRVNFVSIVRSYGWGGKTVEALAGMIPNLKAEVAGTGPVQRAAAGRDPEGPGDPGRHDRRKAP